MPKSTSFMTPFVAVPSKNNCKITMLKKLFPICILALLLSVACTREESDLGVSLNDPFTLYSGIRDTVSLTAFTILDDSLSAAGYSAAVFGNYDDPYFGKVEAIVYSQIMAPKEGIRITDDVVFDSVVMNLVVDTVYPVMPDSTLRQLHLVINQLAEPLRSDSAYSAISSLPESDVCFFDGMVNYYADSMQVRLNENIFPVLRQSCSQAEFLEIVKGISIKLGNRTSNTMLTVNFAATATRLTLYYHTATAPHLTFELTINSDAMHSMYFNHDYSGSDLRAFASNRRDSVAGSHRLYLEPLGGTRVRLRMNDFLTDFHKQHPNAVVHYAELVLPVADEADTSAPVRILALKYNADGTPSYVTDANVLTNAYTYGGFDGYYDRAKRQYRLRMTRHLQELLRTGCDYGTDLFIDARRSSAFRTIINGTETAKPILLDFIYSE